MVTVTGVWRTMLLQESKANKCDKRHGTTTGRH